MANDPDTRFDDIMNRLEQAWGLWQDAIGRVSESDARDVALARSLMHETAVGDEQAVEVIRSLVEGSTYQQLPGRETVEEADDLDGVRSIMEHHHERLLGSLDTVAETAEDIVVAVEEQVGPLTWEQYPVRAERLTTTGDASA
ncbi:MAG TPA: hypothetical protein VGR22_06100 [Thermomicrobiales bacterium]|nr:hypothetical protein [Thermomicrobiales bacterium]